MTAVRIAPAGLDTTDRDRWLELRRQGIGGSDAPALVGADPHHTAWQVWLDKVGRGDDTLTEDQAEWIEFGHEMEAVIARVWARREHIPGRVSRCGMLAHPGRPWMRVNVDRLVSDCGAGLGPCLLECKNRTAWQSAQWSRTGNTDEVPDAPVIQVQHALMVTGRSHGHLAAVIGGNQLRSYVIPADEILQKTLAEEEDWFWHQHVLTGEPPPIDATERTGKILARLWDADPDKVITAPAEIVWRVAALRETALAAGRCDEIIAAHEHEIQQIMGDAEVALDPETGRPLVTWKRNGPFREKAFRADHPTVPRRYQRTVRKIDTAALEAEDPATYRAYRARVFRTPAQPREGT
jgi:putative phage-type endonuclease